MEPERYSESGKMSEEKNSSEGGIMRSITSSQVHLGQSKQLFDKMIEELEEKNVVSMSDPTSREVQLSNQDKKKDMLKNSDGNNIENHRFPEIHHPQEHDINIEREEINNTMNEHQCLWRNYPKEHVQNQECCFNCKENFEASHPNCNEICKYYIRSLPELQTQEDTKQQNLSDKLLNKHKKKKMLFINAVASTINVETFQVIIAHAVKMVENALNYVVVTHLAKTTIKMHKMNQLVPFHHHLNQNHQGLHQ